MSQTNDQKSIKEEIIDLDKSEFKKKSNFLRNFLFFFTVAIISLFGGFAINEYLRFKNINIPYLNKKNENSSQKNYDVILNDLNQKFYIIEENFNSKFLELERESREADSQISENLENLKNLELQDTRESSPKDFYKKYNESENGKIFKSLWENNKILLNFFVLKQKFMDRENIDQELSKLLNTFSENNNIILQVQFLEKVKIDSLKNEIFFLNEINRIISNNTENFDEFINRIERNEGFEVDNFFDSKENFILYLKDIFNSTFRITKMDSSKINNEFKGEKYQSNIKEKLNLSKEAIMNGSFSIALKYLEDINIEKTINLKNLINEINKLISAKESLKKLEQEIFKFLGKNLDENN